MGTKRGIKMDPARLLALKNLTIKKRKDILRNADPTLIHSISECCYNVLRGNVPIKQRSLKALQRYKKIIRKVGNKKISLKVKKKAIIQNGGFIGPLLGLVAPIIGSLLGR